MDHKLGVSVQQKRPYKAVVPNSGPQEPLCSHFYMFPSSNQPYSIDQLLIISSYSFESGVLEEEDM